MFQSTQFGSIGANGQVYEPCGNKQKSNYEAIR